MTPRRWWAKPLAVMPFLISGALLVFIVSRFDGKLLLRVDGRVVVFALLLGVGANIGLGGIKWWLVARLVGIRASPYRFVRLVAGLLPATTFAPFQSGHLLYVFGLRSETGVPFFAALECVAYDKWLSVVATATLVGMGQILLPPEHMLYHPLFLLASGAVVLVFLADGVAFKLLGRWRFFADRSRFLGRIPSTPKKLGLLCLAVIYQASDLVSVALALTALALAVPLSLVASYPVILGLTYLPLSVGGFGVRESALALFNPGAVSFAQGIGAGLLVDAFEYIGPAVIGIVALPRLLRLLARRQAPPRGAGDE